MSDYLNSEMKQTKEAVSRQEDGAGKRYRKDDEIKGAKQVYRLVLYNEKGDVVELSQEEVSRLIENRPELQQYLGNPETIPV